LENIIQIIESISTVLGLDRPGQDLDVWLMVARACVVYLFTLLLIKAAKKRFMGKNSALDVVMLVILGSVISRAINGAAAFMPTLAASIALVVVHRLMAWIACRSESFSNFLEGKSTMLVSNGHIDWDAMRKHDINEKDLHSAMHLALNTDSMEQVKDIYLEPSGKLSVVKKN
jgi:uncharacterized membrane protein YcaP (DUF421 family)